MKKPLKLILIVAAALLFFLELVLEFSNVGQDWNLFLMNLRRFDFKYTLVVICVLICASSFLALIKYKKWAYRTKLTYIMPIVFIIFTSYHLAGLVDYYYGLSEDYNYFRARRDISYGKIQLLAVGLLVDESIEVQKARDSLCQAFGFKTIPVGCIRTEGIERYNETMEDFLVSKNGKDWQQTFYRKMDSIRSIDEKRKASAANKVW
ncbi:hypothetical protein C3K47_02505 [Solitalea longa]|uniref:Uncharacterized protein n=1 Tax=Solitalea longa TaxID=2079460 RepID=A0A2S5AA38_9SPHI|nr:hypothetical protein [Solitalea longa]POY39386.1 hypothetical protein C3K47_02505 [Solitalea longa]